MPSNKATDPMVVRNYVTPYVDRVRKQQGADDVVVYAAGRQLSICVNADEVDPVPKRSHR